jgi:hypothetical protein
VASFSREEYSFGLLESKIVRKLFVLKRRIADGRKVYDEELYNL